MLPLSGTSEKSNDRFIQAVLDSLLRMDRQFVDLSHLKWVGIEAGFRPFFDVQRVQERPFAYEFYHQFRKLWEDGRIGELGYGHTTTQAEVHKGYQDIPRLNKMPDLLVHRAGGKDPDDQVAVIEFKLATNTQCFQADFNKLIDFSYVLNYRYTIEVVVGSEATLTSAQNFIAKSIANPNQYHERPICVHIVYFACDEWRAMIETRTYR